MVTRGPAGGGYSFAAVVIIVPDVRSPLRSSADACNAEYVSERAAKKSGKNVECEELRKTPDHLRPGDTLT